MDYANRYDGIGDYAAWLIRHKARMLVGSAGFTKSDRDDLEQEMVLDLLQRLPKFDSKKAQRNTFVARIVEHKAVSIIEKRTAGKRDWHLCTASLNDRRMTDDGESAERLEGYDMDEYLRQSGQLSRPAEESLGISIDLERIIAVLPPELRVLCERFQSENVAEVSRNTSISRGALYDKIKQIRSLFEDSGLKEYL